MKGRKPKPRHLKLLAGTDVAYRRPQSGVELPTLTEVPDPPDWLPNAHAIREWRRLAPLLVANGLLTEAGMMPFAHLCAIHGKLVQMWAAGTVPTGHLYAQCRGLMSDFGLTPVAASRVKAEAPQKANPWANRPEKPE